MGDVTRCIMCERRPRRFPAVTLIAHHLGLWAICTRCQERYHTRLDVLPVAILSIPSGNSRRVVLDPSWMHRTANEIGARVLGGCGVLLWLMPMPTESQDHLAYRANVKAQDIAAPIIIAGRERRRRKYADNWEDKPRAAHL